MSCEEGQPMLGGRFCQALTLAAVLHQRQVRKGTDVPYVAHLMAVAALVLEDGGDEDLAIAALLHDAVEDQGGRATLALIDSTFGEQVARVVDELSERDSRSEVPWLARKQRHLARLERAGGGALRVKAADAMHNVSGLVDEWERWGPSVWDRFNPRSCPVNQLWYYAETCRIVERLDGSSGLPARLRAAIGTLRERSRPTCDQDHEHPRPS